MPRKNKNPKQSAVAHYHNRTHNIMKPGPMLRKQVVTLKDVYEVSANGNIGNGFATFGVSPNGFRLVNTAPWQAAQQRIFDQYAEFMDYYQVTHVKCRFVPYKWEFKSTTQQVAARPVFSIIDPESQNAIPTTVTQFMAYGNCKITAPYRDHERHMAQFMELAIQKQSQGLIKATNGSWNSREQYGEVATMNFLVQSPAVTTGDPIGVALYEISYVFSGQKQPGSTFSSKPPLPLPSPETTVSPEDKPEPDGLDRNQTISSASNSGSQALMTYHQAVKTLQDLGLQPQTGQ